MNSKLTLSEYISLYDSKTGWVDEMWKNHWEKYLPQLVQGNLIHAGDCTKIACTCSLCFLESMLEEYRKYYFDQDHELKEVIEEHYKGVHNDN